jgi:hypothetical protein
MRHTFACERLTHLSRPDELKGVRTSRKSLVGIVAHGLAPTDTAP